MTTEPKLPPNIFFCRFNQMTAIEAYIIDAETVIDLLEAASTDLTASQAWRISAMKNLIETQNTSKGRDAEKEVEL